MVAEKLIMVAVAGLLLVLAAAYATAAQAPTQPTKINVDAERTIKPCRCGER